MNGQKKIIRDEHSDDEQVEANARADSDNPPTDAAFWADVDMQEPDLRKVPIHIRIEPDVLAFFKKDGPGYQKRINHVLEEYVNWQRA
jgi:uncharacterized protein (DUF4415 family)